MTDYKSSVRQLASGGVEFTLHCEWDKIGQELNPDDCLAPFEIGYLNRSPAFHITNESYSQETRVSTLTVRSMNSEAGKCLADLVLADQELQLAPATETKGAYATIVRWDMVPVPSLGFTTSNLRAALRSMAYSELRPGRWIKPIGFMLMVFAEETEEFGAWFNSTEGKSCLFQSHSLTKDKPVLWHIKHFECFTRTDISTESSFELPTIPGLDDL